MGEGVGVEEEGRTRGVEEGVGEKGSGGRARLSHNVHDVAGDGGLVVFSGDLKGGEGGKLVGKRDKRRDTETERQETKSETHERKIDPPFHTGRASPSPP